MTALKRFLPRAVLALVAMTLHLGVTPRSPGEHSAWLPVNLIAAAHADDDDGGDDGGGGGDSGDDGGGDSGDSGDSGDGGDSAESGDEADSEVEDADEAEETEVEETEEEGVDIESHDDGIEYVRGEVIGVGIGAAESDDIERLGGRVVDTDYYPALGITVTHIQAPAGRGAATLQAELNADDSGVYDLNHAYRLATIGASRPATTGVARPAETPADQPAKSAANSQSSPLALLRGADRPDWCGSDVRLGLVDTAVKLDRLGPRAQQVRMQRFAPGQSHNAAHGTAIVGLLPGAPPDGPRGAPPAYPAAYSGVVTVTAVNPQIGIFSHANRGFYIDLAAPGVGLSVAPGQQADGTSLAAIYVSAALADAVASGANARKAADRLLADARDLGPAGWDPTYGYGLLLRPLSCPRKTLTK